MPKTRAASKAPDMQEVDINSDESNTTIHELNAAGPSGHSTKVGLGAATAYREARTSHDASMEEKLNRMMQQILDLQAEVQRSSQRLIESEQRRQQLEEQQREQLSDQRRQHMENQQREWVDGQSGANVFRTSTVDTSEDSGTPSLAAVLGELSRTLSSSRVDHRGKLYDLPEFDGRAEQWPMFLESYKLSTEEYRYTERQNLIRLQKAIKGKARETVECLLIHSRNVQRIIDTLHENFGRPDQLVKSQIEKIRNVPMIPENRIDQLVPFAAKVQNLVSFLESAQNEHHLCNPTLMEELVQKLPVQRRLDWARYAIKVKPRATIQHLSEWLRELASTVNMACIGFSERPQQPNAKDVGRSRLFHVNETGSEVRFENGCRLCSGQHVMTKCRRFLDLDVGRRWRIVRQLRLCFNCLQIGHRGNSCAQQHYCDVNGCTKRFHNLLHDPTKVGDVAGQNVGKLPKVPKLVKETKQPKPKIFSGVLQETEADHPKPSFTSVVRECSSTKLLFKILPVKLYARGKEVKCYAFFDEGSSVSLVNESLVNRLGLDGEEDYLTLQWFGNNTVTESSRRVHMQVSGNWPNSKRFDLKNVRTVKDLKLPSQTLDITKLHLKYRYRKNLPICYYADATPELLIGLDYAYLGVPRRIAADGWKGPAVVLTKLGWVVYGDEKDGTPRQSHHAYFAQVRDASMDNLEQRVNDYIANENLNVRDVVKHVESSENVRANLLLEGTTKRKGQRFETGLLWKHDGVILPPSRGMAEKRLQALENKFQRDDLYHKEYCRIMDEYEKKGYSRKISTAEAAKVGPRTWYLPHFGVINTNKPGKVRLVFDAAAEVNGISLNSALLSGPDQCQDLATVLSKFREKPIGVCADIVEMFHQVQILEEDQDSQRFLWRTSRSEAVSEYVMNVMTFGATCSPCSAQFVKNKNAEYFRLKFPAAVKAIVENHYVDDFVHCFVDEREAVKVSEEVVWIHKQGGFELKRFVSNSMLVNNRFNEDQEKTSILNLERGGTANFQKVLGMHWDTTRDVLQFVMAFGKIDPVLLRGERRPTKRETLSITMSVFDPFGLAAEYSLMAKVILQIIWRAQIEWDDGIPDEANEMWKKWLRKLMEVENICIPRCYSAVFSCVPVELHVFADASEIAYAAVGYWRIPEQAGKVHLAFVAGKAKCAPLKLTSVPRLELQSAVLATRLRQTILSRHNITPTRVVMWSDSRTVLSWIASDHRRYKPYVAHRVNEILESTDVTEWRWVPSTFNPADFGTRLKSATRNSFWINGPKFLMEDESAWPINQPLLKTNEEIRNKFVLLINIASDDFSRFSSFIRLKRVVGWILRFRKNCLLAPTKRKQGGLTAMELDTAELAICRSVQMSAFAQDYNALNMKGHVEKNSFLWKLTPCLNESRVICVNGRINDAVEVPYHTRRPMVLPKIHHVTNLIVNHYHCLWKHQNENTIISEIRRRYWIPHIRVVVRRIANTCPVCKIAKSKPIVPLMGQLPPDRLTPFVRPFSYVGLDYMGPFLVVNGRRTEKRWVALFTCMTTRAVHLEIARDLSTDTCLMCIRNFMSRRGTPVRIRSDNGTNFVGADRELQKQLKEFDQGMIADALATKNIEWVFNCPLNPHAGGCWERLVRSVKRAMGHALFGESLHEHSLYSLMCEAENIVNSRPLTHIPLDTPTEEPLTPNHFLIGTSNSDQTPHPHEEKLFATRKQWRKVQQIQYRFWKKWLAEYLPDLCRRTKWYRPVASLTVGDLVLVCDSSVHRSKWPMGRITKVFPGRDLQVRAAEVRVKSGIIKRPACLLAKLDIGVSESEG